jgi:hypothetical protein
MAKMARNMKKNTHKDPITTKIPRHPNKNPKTLSKEITFAFMYLKPNILRTGMGGLYCSQSWYSFLSLL